MLELLSEPLYILAAVQLRFRLRALVDTAAIVAKSATTVALLQLTALPPALALSWAQMAFAAMTVLWYGAAYVRDVPSWLVEESSDAAAVCRQQEWVDSSSQQSQAPSGAAQSAVPDSTVRQRKLTQQPGTPAGGIKVTKSPARDRQQLLHGPTLWLCGSFSLQASVLMHASHCS
jgi:hypothetical protein